MNGTASSYGIIVRFRSLGWRIQRHLGMGLSLPFETAYDASGFYRRALVSECAANRSCVWRREPEGERVRLLARSARVKIEKRGAADGRRRR